MNIKKTKLPVYQFSPIYVCWFPYAGQYFVDKQEADTNI